MMESWRPYAYAEYRGLTPCGQVERTEVPSPLLLPAESEDRLHILRPLIDGLIPTEAGLLREGGLRLNQLIDLGIQPGRRFKY